MKRSLVAVAPLSLSVAALALILLAIPPQAARAQAFFGVAQPAARPDYAPGEYFVTFRAGVTNENLAAVRAMGASITGAFPAIRAIAVRSATANLPQVLAQNARVAFVEPVPMRYALSLEDAQLVPSLNNGLYGLITTRATDTHARGVTGAGINVGVADTGLDYTHPDIAPNYKGGIDYVSNDSDPWWNNDHGETHGTHVAGTILAADNAKGVLGVAYSANLYHARVLSASGGSSAQVMNGVRWLVETAQCKVVNLSLGGAPPSATEEAFYNDMRSKGALIVCAAGNDGKVGLIYPAAYASNISVGAVDRNNAHASFSNTGTGLDVSAPGVTVLSSVPLNQGMESSVSTTETFTAIGLEYAGTTPGITRPMIDCAMGKIGEFPPAVSGNIALMRRGDIAFSEKVTNAKNAGAVAAIIYNNVSGDFKGTLQNAGAWIPAVSVSDVTGATLVSQAGTNATVMNTVSRWDHYDGTSMATPHVTGTIALIWSINPYLPNSTVEDCLFTTCKDLGTAGYDTTFGNGLIDAYAAVAKAEAGAQPPPAPTNLTATAGSGQVALSWTASAGATSYKVKRADASGGPYTTVASGVTTTAYTDSGLVNGTTYFYVVSAVNFAGESADSNEASATPQPSPPPAAPTGLTATAGNAQVALSWTGSAGATGYNVKRSTTTGGPYTTVTGVSSTSYTDTGLTNGTTYYYVVTAVNADGESGNSNEASATPTAPVDQMNVTVWTTDWFGITRTSYRFGQIVYIWTQARNIYGLPVSGAAVSLDIRTPSGRRYVGSGTTDASGYVIFYKIFSATDGAGTYTATSTVTKIGFTGTGRSTFTVR